MLLAIARETQTPAVALQQATEGMDDRAAMIAMFEMAFSISETQLPFMRTLVSEAWVDDGILEDFVIFTQFQSHRLGNFDITCIAPLLVLDPARRGWRRLQLQRAQRRLGVGGRQFSQRLGAPGHGLDARQQRVAIHRHPAG